MSRWQCKVCEKELKESARILPCGHSLCFECLSEKIKLPQRSCPLCEYPFSLTIEELPHNIPFLHWKNLKNSQNNVNNNNNNTLKSNSSNVMQSNPKSLIFIPPNTNFINTDTSNNNNNNYETEYEYNNNKNKCQECEINIAEICCEICTHILCSECTTKIHSPKVMRNHTQIPISQKIVKKQTSISKCKNHSEKEKELYCKICCSSLCTLCISDHTGHFIVHINELIKEKQNEWKEELSKVSPVIIRMNDQIGVIDSEIKNHLNEIELLQAKVNSLIDKRSSMEKLKVNINSTTQFLRFTIDTYNNLNSIDGGDIGNDKFILLFSRDQLAKIYKEICPSIDIFSRNLKWSQSDNAIIEDNILISNDSRGWGNTCEFSTKSYSINIIIEPKNNGWFAIGVGKLRENSSFNPGRDSWAEVGYVDFYYNAYNGKVNDVEVPGSMKRTEHCLISLSFDDGLLSVKVGDFQLPGSYRVPELSILYVDIYHPESRALLE